MPDPRVNWLPPVTTAYTAWLACVRFFPANTLGTDARLTMGTLTCYLQYFQFVETDIQAWYPGGPKFLASRTAARNMRWAVA